MPLETAIMSGHLREGVRMPLEIAIMSGHLREGVRMPLEIAIRLDPLPEVTWRLYSCSCSTL
jgi:hypothetical protein